MDPHAHPDASETGPTSRNCYHGRICRAFRGGDSGSSALIGGGHSPIAPTDGGGLDDRAMLSWFRALMPKEDRFFDLFERHSRTLVTGAEALKGLLEGGERVPEFSQKIVEAEDEADTITRDVLVAVRRSFITPFDRGDIKDLIQSMDDAIDQMKKTVKTITLFEQTSFEPRMRDMGEAIVEAARLTSEAVPLLNDIGRHAGRLNVLTEQVTRIEGRADDLHYEGLRALFQGHGHSAPMTYIVGAEIYDHLEKVMDRFEDVANEISAIVIENV
jgi:predicted phosphate transport protein (TIGR00153 family)